MTLNKGQTEAKIAIETGRNTLISGGAGVGKSHLMREVTDKGTILCAPTGAAALQIGGVTASSLFGLPLGVCLDSDRFKGAHKLEQLFAEGGVSKVVLDEASMLRADQFCLIDTKLRNVTRKDVPFGGVQMVLVGDMYQLPPIVAKQEKKVFFDLYKSPWLFDSMSWEMGKIKTTLLTEVMRQEDVAQQGMLAAVRTKSDNWIQAVDDINDVAKQRPIDGIWLCNYNKTVDMINMSRYKEISGEEKVYHGSGKGFKPHELPVAQELTLKVGCRVLIKANDINGTYVNGSQGYVKSLSDEYIEVETLNGNSVFVEKFSWDKYDYVMGLTGLERKKVASFKQFPIKMGWAISVHGSQGCTLDSVNIDFGRGCFSEGQAYVALSRVKDLKNMFIQGGLNYSDIIVDQRVKDFYAREGL